MAIKRKDVEVAIRFAIYQPLGMDRPANHDEIVDFIHDDVEAAADHVLWHYGDVTIAFRRFLERDTEV